MKNEYILSVDLKKKMNNITPIFLQHDSGRLLFKIYDRGEIYDLNKVEEIQVSHRREDGKVIVGFGEKHTFSDGVVGVKYDYLGSEMNYAGNVATSVSLMSDKGKTKISILPFNVKIVTDDRDYAVEDVGALTQIIEESNKILRQLKVALDKANSNNQKTEEIIKQANERIAKMDSQLAQIAQATDNANKATQEAIKATQDTINATKATVTATSKANTAIQNANSATSSAKEATEKASIATEKTNQAILDAQNIKTTTEKVKNDTLQVKNDTVKVKNDTENVRLATIEIKESTDTVRKETEKLRDETQVLYSEVTTLKIETEKTKKTTIEATNRANQASSLVDSKVSEYDAYIQQFQYLSLYDSTKYYDKNSMVLYNGSSFIALKEVKPNIFPPDLQLANKNEYWHLLAQKGVDGKGAVSSVNGVLPSASGNVIVDKAQKLVITGKQSDSLSVKNIAITPTEPKGAKNGDIWFVINEEELK